MLLASLTNREREVLNLIVAGLSAKEMSRILGISHRTVEAHIARLRKKFNASNRAALAAYGVSAEKTTAADGT